MTSQPTSTTRSSPKAARSGGTASTGSPAGTGSSARTNLSGRRFSNAPSVARDGYGPPDTPRSRRSPPPPAAADPALLGRPVRDVAVRLRRLQGRRHRPVAAPGGPLRPHDRGALPVRV